MNYFFRDLDNQSNLLNGKTYHAAGLARLEAVLGKPNYSGKDVHVTFLNPFTGYVVNAWRAFAEIELFEVDDFEYENMQKTFDAIENMEIL